MVGSNPLSPAVVIGGGDTGAVVDAEDISERACAEWSGIAFIGMPAFKQQLIDGGDYIRIVAEGLPRPVLSDLSVRQHRIPRKASEAIKVRHGEWVMEPVGVEPHVGDADEAAKGLLEALAADNVANECGLVIDAQVSVQRGTPHRDEVDE